MEGCILVAEVLNIWLKNLDYNEFIIDVITGYLFKQGCDMNESMILCVYLQWYL